MQSAYGHARALLLVLNASPSPTTPERVHQLLNLLANDTGVISPARSALVLRVLSRAWGR